MSDKASEAIQDAFSKREYCMMTGLWRGPIWLSPATMKTTKSPHFWQPRAKLTANMIDKARPLDSQIWTTQGKNVFVHIFDGGIRFPELCSVTLGPVARYEVAEVPIGRTPVRGQTNANAGRARRIGIAIGCDRYWYALPFSENHGTKDRAIHLHLNPNPKTAHLNPLEIVIRNKDYAIQFARSMGLKGRWISRKHILRSMIGAFSTYILGIGGFGFALSFLSKHPIVKFSVWGVPVILLCLIGLIYGIILMVQGNKGEPLIQE